jgi:cytosine/adenosine deaminase-related metal-dependent hydrolase
MLLKNISALLGEELDFVSNVDIEIKNNKFQKIQPEIKSTLENDTVDCQGLLLIPGFINAHTHIADSIGKDITINSTVNQKIHPMFGIKSKILKNTSEENLSTFMKNTCHSMIVKALLHLLILEKGV